MAGRAPLHTDLCRPSQQRVANRSRFSPHEGQTLRLTIHQSSVFEFTTQGVFWRAGVCEEWASIASIRPSRLWRHQS